MSKIRVLPEMDSCGNHFVALQEPRCPALLNRLQKFCNSPFLLEPLTALFSSTSIVSVVCCTVADSI